MHGFQLFMTLGGGTGAGLGARLVEELADTYPRAVLVPFPVLPSPKVCAAVLTCEYRSRN